MRPRSRTCCRWASTCRRRCPRRATTRRPCCRRWRRPAAREAATRRFPRRRSRRCRPSPRSSTSAGSATRWPTRPPRSARAATTAPALPTPATRRNRTMADYLERAGLRVAAELVQLVENDVGPRSVPDPARFWNEFERLLDRLVPQNQALLARRDALQSQVDAWHRARRGQPFDVAAHEKHLREIGYLVPAGQDFSIGTGNVDAEIARLAGPQLVVPLDNARYALNAANARWGS